MSLIKIKFNIFFLMFKMQFCPIQKYIDRIGCKAFEHDRKYNSQYKEENYNSLKRNKR